MDVMDGLGLLGLGPDSSSSDGASLLLPILSPNAVGKTAEAQGETSAFVYTCNNIDFAEGCG